MSSQTQLYQNAWLIKCLKFVKQNMFTTEIHVFVRMTLFCYSLGLLIVRDHVLNSAQVVLRVRGIPEDLWSF